jgi:hypothetical protein
MWLLNITEHSTFVPNLDMMQVSLLWLNMSNSVIDNSMWKQYIGLNCISNGIAEYDSTKLHISYPAITTTVGHYRNGL